MKEGNVVCWNVHCMINTLTLVRLVLECRLLETVLQLMWRASIDFEGIAKLFEG